MTTTASTRRPPLPALPAGFDWSAQHRVRHRHAGHRQPIEDLEKLVAIAAPVEPVLMLDDHDVEHVQTAGCGLDRRSDPLRNSVTTPIVGRSTGAIRDAYNADITRTALFEAASECGSERRKTTCGRRVGAQDPIPATVGRGRESSAGISCMQTPRTARAETSNLHGATAQSDRPAQARRPSRGDVTPTLPCSPGSPAVAHPRCAHAPGPSTRVVGRQA